MLSRTEEEAKRHEDAEARRERPTSRLRAFAPSCLSFHRDDTGTAITEAALVMLPLVFFLMIAPAIALIWASEQYARTEAHRDMFDKTTIVMLIPEAPHPSGSDSGITSGHFGNISVPDRLHLYPTFPPSIGDLSPNPNSLVKAPGGLELTVSNKLVEAFPDGFPNQYVEGWQYLKVKPRGGWFPDDFEIDFMRYGAVIRTPWTWLGWPFVPMQDIYWEPRQIHAWYDDAGKIEDDTKTALKLVD